MMFHRYLMNREYNPWKMDNINGQESSSLFLKILLIILILFDHNQSVSSLSSLSSLYNSSPYYNNNQQSSVNRRHSHLFHQHHPQSHLHHNRHHISSSSIIDDEVNFSLSQEEYGRDGEYIGGVEPGGDASMTDANDHNNQLQERLPEFVSQVPNITVQVGREARLPCVVRNLQSYRTAWIRDEEKNILTLQRQMVTRDPRISLQEESQIDGAIPGPPPSNIDSYLSSSSHHHHHHSMNESPSSSSFAKIRYFVLIIRNVQFSDRGGYMCQVNTVPMRSQIGYLSVVVPPDIIDHESSNDVMVREGENVTLKCKARGHPEPVIEWRREDGARVPLGNRNYNSNINNNNTNINNNNNNGRVMVNKTEGEFLEITRVTRVHSGAWLCIASNGVMPSVSRRILLNVQFAPQIWIPTEEIGAPFGSNITLDCHIEAYPLPLNYWTFGIHSESIYISGPKYEVTVKEKGYKRHLKLTIQKLTNEDLGVYKCHAQNSLGRQVKQVKIYASSTHQQTESIRPSLVSQSISSSSSSNKNNIRGGAKSQSSNKKKKRRRKFKSDNSTSTSSSSTSNGFLYSVINSLSGGGGRGKAASSSNNNNKNEFELYDHNEQQEEEEEDDLEDYSDFYDESTQASHAIGVGVAYSSTPPTLLAIIIILIAHRL